MITARARLLGGLLLVCPALAPAADEPTIVVRGKRAEATRPRRAGRSKIVRPDDATRFDSSAHLKAESSMQTVDQGRATAAGFAVPRIRGQEARLTEVYLEDTLLQDPYSGLPLTDDLDLRAFGELDLHQGLAPPDVPSLSPIGILRYRLRQPTRAETSLGIDYGRPYGSGVWALRAARHETSDVVASYRLYGRRYQTDGRFSYYSDHATPYYAGDDRIVWRTNNDKTASQLLPLIEISVGRHTTRVLAWWNESRGGLPAPSEAAPSLAREHRRNRLIDIGWRYEMAPPGDLVPTRMNLSVTDLDDDRTLDDPTRVYLATASHSSFAVTSRRGRLAFDWEGGGYDGHIGTGYGLARVASRASDGRALDVSRKTAQWYGGLALEPGGGWQVELKSTVLSLNDELGSFDGALTSVPPGPPRRRQKVVGHGLGLAWRGASWLGYGQLGYIERPPSLLEQFGDGGRVFGSPGLRPEVIHHREVGMSAEVLARRVRWGLSAFEDVTHDKILFLPALQHALRALNIQDTVIRGVDTSLAASFGATRVGLSVTRLYPYDLSGSVRRRLPTLPEWTAAAELEQGLGICTARLLTRHRSAIFRDEAQSIIVPRHTVVDVSLDGNIAASEETVWQWGIAVNNATDVKRLPIHAASGQTSRGYTSLGDVEGYPLPGRHWRASLAVKF